MSEIVEIDTEAQAGYVTVSSRPIARTKILTDDLIVDLDDKGDVVGVEVLDLASPQDDRRLTLDESIALVQERYAEALATLRQM